MKLYVFACIYYADTKENYGTLDGRAVVFTLVNKHKLKALITNYGGNSQLRMS